MTDRLRVDWPACRARGLCHEAAPDLVQLDEWGFPIIREPVPEEQLRDAREAVRLCPQSALRLVRTR